MTSPSIVCPLYAPLGMAGAMRSAENPTVPLSQAIFHDDFMDALAGPRTATGIRVGRKKALGYSAVWRATNLISKKIAALPTKVFKTVGPGKEVDRRHPAYWLLRRKPNEYMTPIVFKTTLQSHALLRGNGYAYVFRDGDAKPIELLVLNPESTWPVRENGRLLYITEIKTDDRGGYERRKLPAADVIHIRGLGFDGLAGYDVITILRETLAKAIATREHGARFFGNNAKPSLALEFPAGMRDDAIRAVVNSWAQMNQGLENAHKVAILRENVNIKTFSSNARDSQLTENLAFDAVDIANVFGLPPRKLGMDQGGGYNSLFEENQSVHDDTLDPWIATWEEELDEKLLTEKQKENETHCCLFVRNAVMRSNPDQRASFYEKMLQNGLMSPDEARALEDMNPIPDGKGAAFYIKAGIKPVGQQPEPASLPPPPADRAGVMVAARKIAATTAARMARRLQTNATRGRSLDGEDASIIEALQPIVELTSAIGLKGELHLSAAKSISDEMLRYALKNAPNEANYVEKLTEIALKTLFPEA